jgi:hypothetical protein
MKPGNRDLLVLTKFEVPNVAAMEREVKFLNNLLFSVENLHCFCTANEIIDVNKYKIIRKPHLIQQVIRERAIKPFVFVFNKN